MNESGFPEKIRLEVAAAAEGIDVLMNIVIVGIGKVGSTVAEYLSGEGHDVIIVDKNPRSWNG